MSTATVDTRDRATRLAAVRERYAGEIAAVHAAAVEPYLAAHLALFEQMRAGELTYQAFEKALEAPLRRAGEKLTRQLGELVPDPYERGEVIASVMIPAEEQVTKARARRDLAALVLVEEEGWQPVKVYRLIGVSRALLVRFRNRGPAQLPKMKNADKVARKAADEVVRTEATISVWRKARNVTIWRLFDARPDLTNAKIGELFGTTGQRITIMRRRFR